MKTIGIAGNIEKPQVVRVARSLVSELRRLKQRFHLETGLARKLDLPGGTSIHEMGRACRLLVVLGGDGTVLRVAREAHPHEIPILPVNLGKLGFLAAVAPGRLHDILPAVLRGQSSHSSHSTLSVSVRGGTRNLRGLIALNDAVISRGVVSRVIEMELRVDGQFLNSYMCDGMIFSTATGSTAYSLSAGGPIVVPWARVFAITPICPHTLSNRSMIVGENSRVETRVISRPGELFLGLDGQSVVRLNADDVVTVKIGKYKVRMITVPGISYFELLRKKLHWSGSNIQSKPT